MGKWDVFTVVVYSELVKRTSHTPSIAHTWWEIMAPFPKRQYVGDAGSDRIPFFNDLRFYDFSDFSPFFYKRKQGGGKE